MTGEEFLFLSKTASQNEEAKNQDSPPQSNSEKKYVYGIDGIAEIFGCSRPTASRIKKSGRINATIRQIGRKIVVDVELALSPCRAEEGGSQMVTMKGNPYRYLQDFYY